MPEKKKKLPKAPPSRPRHANPKHPMNTERTTGRNVARKKSGGSTKKKVPTPKPLRQAMKEKFEENVRSANFGAPDKPVGFPFMIPAKDSKELKKRAFNKTIRENPKAVKRLNKMAKKSKTMKSGGKLKMVEKDGKKVPFFAADGVGKMAKGGKTKKANPSNTLDIATHFKKKGVSLKPSSLSKKATGGPVEVKKGMTLSQIAKNNNTSIQALLAANPSIKNANQIRIGQKIKMPKAGSVPGNTKTKNPYARMSKTQMNMMRSKDKGQQRAVTSAMRNEAKNTGAQTTPTPKKAAAVKDARSAVPKAKRDALIAQMKAANKKKPTKVSRRVGRKRAGGMMKKGLGYKSGGMVRGAGAATKGKRFTRAG